MNPPNMAQYSPNSYSTTTPYQHSNTYTLQNPNDGTESLQSNKTAEKLKILHKHSQGLIYRVNYLLQSTKKESNKPITQLLDKSSSPISSVLKALGKSKMKNDLAGLLSGGGGGGGSGFSGGTMSKDLNLLRQYKKEIVGSFEAGYNTFIEILEFRNYFRDLRAGFVGTPFVDRNF